MSLRENIISLAKEKYPETIGNIKFEVWCNEQGYKASNGERRLRELATEGILERLEENGYVVYKLKVVGQQSLI